MIHAPTTAKPRRTGRRAFTLIELLVVIAIIVLVISIIIPALGGARDVARKTSTKSLMTQLSTSIGEFRNDHDGAMPGLFTPAEIGDANNAAFGLTAMENVMLDLYGEEAIGNGTDTITLDPTASGTGIDVGLDLLGAGDHIHFAPPATSLVAQENQLGTIDKRLPDLVDAFGNPIIIWVEDPGAPSTPLDVDDVAQIDSGTQRSRFYWNSNAAFLNVPVLGKTGAQQFANSMISTGPNGGDLQEAIAAITGDPASPTPVGFDVNSVLPAKSRGSYVIQSAGSDGIFFSKNERGGKSLPMDELKYAWNFFKADGTRITDEADNTTSEDIISGFNDLIVSGK